MIGAPPYRSPNAGHNNSGHRRNCNLPCRVDVGNGIAFDIAIGICSPSQPDRVALDIAPYLRIVVAEVVVVYWP